MSWTTTWDKAKAELENLIQDNEKVLVTISLSYKTPSICDEECSFDEIEEKYRPDKYFCEVGRYPRDNKVHLNLLSGNDMF